MKCCRNVEAGVFNEHCSFILEMMLQGGHWVAIIGYCSIILNIIGSCTIDRKEHKGSGSQYLL